eukprot:g13944.t1
MSEVHIPTIDIEPLLESSGGSYTDEDRAATATSLMRACEVHGLFFVTGHGIKAAQRRIAFENARRFFSLPETEKRKVPAEKGGFTRGYIGFGGESGSHLLECKEAFSYGYPWPDDQSPTNALQGSNIWPKSESLAVDWRDSMVTLFRQMVSVNEAVARGLSLCPDLGLQGLPNLCHGGDTISLLRLFHYFPYGDGNHTTGDTNTCGSVEDGSSSNGKIDGDSIRDGSRSRSRSREDNGPGKIGSSPHTDWGLSTSILQDGAGGLQFLEQATQRWIDVPCAQEDALVFNCGDYLSLLSNGRLKSPVHQVVTTGVERTSFVFFYYPNFDAKLPAAVANCGGSSCVGTDDHSGPGEGESAANVTAASALLVPPPPAALGGTGVPTAAAEAPAMPKGNRAEATAAAPRDVPSAAAANRGIGPYNTLLDLKRGDASNSNSNSNSGGGGGDNTTNAADDSFGQYLARKWGAVFRE